MQHYDIVAMVDIMNNLLINHIPRRRAIAMYKSVGMSHEQNAALVLVEGFSAGLIDVIFAMTVSWLEI